MRAVSDLHPGVGTTRPDTTCDGARFVLLPSRGHPAPCPNCGHVAGVLWHWQHDARPSHLRVVACEPCAGTCEGLPLARGQRRHLRAVVAS